MRVWHSAWSWLNAIVALDSVAGNTLIGMFTRLIFRKPFHVARAAIDSLYRSLDVFSFVVVPEIETGACELYSVFPDFVPQKTPRRPVAVARDRETACKIAQS